MCSWERFCAFAREPERRSVAGDATVSVEGASYEVEPELAGETVTLWWGLFDQELFVEFEGKRFGPYQDRNAAAFKKAIPNLAWGSFAWCVSEPEHLIALDGTMPGGIKLLSDFSQPS